MTDDEKARETAHALIQGYIGMDHRVINMNAFYSALVQALRDAGADALENCDYSPCGNTFRRHDLHHTGGDRHLRPDIVATVKS